MSDIADPLSEEWAERIRFARRRLRENQTDFGQRIGVSRETISTWERAEALPRPHHRKLLIEQVFTLLCTFAFLAAILEQLADWCPGC